jgi:mRNA interferase RelE/StbE
MLQDIADRRIREKIRDTIDRLAEEPEKQGKPLIGELSGYRTLRAAGQRFRIIFRIENRTVVVMVVAVGIRRDGSSRDVYTLAKKLVRLGLLGAAE